MKKIIFTLFLLLGAVSFAVPKYIDVDKLQKAGYQIIADDEDLFSIGKTSEDFLISIAFYPMENESSKYISDAVKNSAPDTVKFVSSAENKRVYIHKFSESSAYTYNFVPKKQKIKDCHISVLYMTDKNLSGANLDKVIDGVLNEAENLLK